MTDFFLALSESPAYWLCMTFLAGFPVVVAALVVNGSRSLLLDRQSEATERYFPHREDLDRARERWPLVTVIVPARDEERTIVDTVSAILEIDWPQLRVIVVDDGSTDSTAQQLATLSHNPSVQVLSHPEPLGKSESLNEGFALATSEIVLIMDADAAPAANVLNRMVPYFIKHRDIAAVTGNPRVVNASGLWGKLQAIEFTSTISALRRGQSAWGRINTISGVLSVLRRDVVLALGGFSSVHPTEDIELTWRVHRAGYRCVYEPAALVAMRVPETLAQWWHQRYRWSSGLIRVLQAHGVGLVRERRWPMFPLLLEAFLSVVWCHLLWLATVLWIVALALGGPDVGNSLIISHWGAMTIGIALVQIFWGMHLDGNHDRTIWKLWPLAPVYPILYWWAEALVVAAATLPTLVTKPRRVSWTLDRAAGPTTTGAAS